MPSKKFKKRAALGQAAPEIANALQRLDKVAQNTVEDKPYDQFGKYVAAELRQLSQRHAILLQQEIQNCVTRSKLYCLPPKNKFVSMSCHLVHLQVQPIHLLPSP
jgi:hypothetical protein